MHAMWLKQQRIQIVNDFYEYAHWKLLLQKDNRVLIDEKMDLGTESMRVK